LAPIPWLTSTAKTTFKKLAAVMSLSLKNTVKHVPENKNENLLNYDFVHCLPFSVRNLFN
jgi:hypothetical protein